MLPQWGTSVFTRVCKQACKLQEQNSVRECERAQAYLPSIANKSQVSRCSQPATPHPTSTLACHEGVVAAVVVVEHYHVFQQPRSKTRLDGDHARGNHKPLGPCECIVLKHVLQQRIPDGDGLVTVEQLHMIRVAHKSTQPDEGVRTLMWSGS